ncbi:MAG: ABC transporter transmembrane domain-containing protein [Bacteroidetes bacterium]|nr:ABC transporter transmembrane domain-containing protein [Bacteroidota bacterium]MDA0904128.1 ABC transporter transmembrane domain-containing protein [Bacteroidota bacterium]MDA1242652.1 ABC transporter transmembrane domain-containing protein [Bacteroidota bacterium]
MRVYLKPFTMHFIVGMVIMSISGVLTLVITRLWGQLGGVGTSGGQGELPVLGIPLDNLSTIGWTLLIVLVVQAVFSFIRVILFADMTEKMMLAMRTDAFDALVSMPMAFYDARRVGDLNSRISADIATIQDIFTVTLAELFRGLILIVGGIAALAYFSVELTLWMLATLPVMIVTAVVFGRFIRKLSKQTQDEVADSNIVVQEVLTAIVSVKSYANEWLERTKYGSHAETIRQLAMRGAWWRGSFASFIILFIFGAITLVIFKGAALMQEGDLASEHFFTFLLMTGLVAGSIGGMAAQFSALQRGLGAIESVMDIIEQDREVTRIEASPTEVSLRATLALDQVHFNYPQRPDVPVLQGLSLTIAPGEQVALVGASGAGKSTVASLLLRFHEPQHGQITADGIPVQNLDLRGYRKRVAFVPQEVILFGGDLRSNIRYGNPEATEEEVIDAAKRAYAWEFIEEFPEGLDTVVGERGVQLSGGQRQRIALARAILRDPDLLVLDEATSALDSTSEREVQAALEGLMKGRSSLVIAHRLSTVKNADRICVMADGRVVEQGTHAELMALRGHFKKLVENQELFSGA